MKLNIAILESCELKASTFLFSLQFFEKDLALMELSALKGKLPNFTFYHFTIISCN